MKLCYILIILLVFVVLADPPPRKEREKLKPKPPSWGKLKKGPKAFKPGKDDLERKKERLMDQMEKKGKGGPKGKGPKGKGGELPPWAKRKGKGAKGAKPRRPPPLKGKGKGFDKGSPRGWNKPPKLPADRFGPCQACYAVVSNMELSLPSWSEEEREALNYDEYCPNAVQNYTLVSSPKGRGMPIIQGPGLPDVREKLKEGEEMGEVSDDLTQRFLKDFKKICTKTFLEFKEKIFQVFTPKEGINVDDAKEMARWKSGIKRSICNKYCKKPKLPAMNFKAEL